MIWWRVELDTSGAILKVEQVEYAAQNKRLVRFVEADTKAEACNNAKRWYVAKLARDREIQSTKCKARRDAGLCSKCGRRPGAPRRIWCTLCLERKAVESRRWRAGLSVPNHNDENIAYARRAGINAYAALKRFDEIGPVAFRAWLVEKLNARGANVT